MTGPEPDEPGEPVVSGGTPADPEGDRLPSPPTHLVARSAIAVTTLGVAVAVVVLGVVYDLPGELLELVARYFDWLIGLVG